MAGAGFGSPRFWFHSPHPHRGRRNDENRANRDFGFWDCRFWMGQTAASCRPRSSGIGARTGSSAVRTRRESCQTGAPITACRVAGEPRPARPPKAPNPLARTANDDPDPLAPRVSSLRQIHRGEPRTCPSAPRLALWWWLTRRGSPGGRFPPADPPHLQSFRDPTYEPPAAPIPPMGNRFSSSVPSVPSVAEGRYPGGLFPWIQLSINILNPSPALPADSHPQKSSETL